MRTRAFWTVSLAGALGFPVALALGDVVLGPPSGVWQLLLWPVEVLLWATGPGVRLTNGKFEWTPVQDLAVWVGIGVSWFFWVTVTFVIARFAGWKLLPDRSSTRHSAHLCCRYQTTADQPNAPSRRVAPSAPLDDAQDKKNGPDRDGCSRSTVAVGKQCWKEHVAQRCGNEQPSGREEQDGSNRPLRHGLIVAHSRRRDSERRAAHDSG